MNFELNKDQYEILKKYADFSEVPSIELKDDCCKVAVSEDDIEAFRMSVSDMLDIYGFGLDDEITSFGRKLEGIYDTIYSQIVYRG